MEFPFKPISLYGMFPFGDRVALAPPCHCLVCLPLCPHVVAVVQVMGGYSVALLLCTHPGMACGLMYGGGVVVGLLCFSSGCVCQDWYDQGTTLDHPFLNLFVYFLLPHPSVCALVWYAVATPAGRRDSTWFQCAFVAPHRTLLTPPRLRMGRSLLIDRFMQEENG